MNIFLKIWVRLFAPNVNDELVQLKIIKRPLALPPSALEGDEGVGGVGGVWFQSSASGRRHGSTLRRPIDLRASETDLNRIAFDVVELSVEGSGFACV